MSSPDRAPSTAETIIASRELQPDPLPSSKKPLRFWLVFFAVCLSVFLSALELSSVGTALPTIVDALQGKDFVWVGSAYALSSTAFLPASGGLSNIFGRRPVMLSSIILFSIGSAICGASKSLNMLIAGRTIQGMGGGGIISLAEIIVADMVPLRERGKYGGLIGSVWALASVLGPIVGGSLATSGQWRWLFYLNLPLAGLAFVLVSAFLTLRTPQDSLLIKLRRMDWTGNAIIVASTTAVIIALAWGGIKYSWASYHVLLPLLLGFAGMVLFMGYEARFATEPVVPIHLLQNRTTLSGYLGTFLHGLTSAMVIYYLPTYFQAAHEASATASGVDLFGTAFVIAPFAIMCGISVEITGKYVIQNYIAWILIIVGSGTMSILRSTSSRGLGIGLQVIPSIGYGMLFPGTTFPVLAPLPVSDNAHALALYTFVRSFGQTFGITIGSTILQNGLTHKLPASFLAQFPQGVEISYAIIPRIPMIPDPLRSQIKAAFADSIKNVWIVNAGIGGLGLLTVLLMREVKLHVMTDDNWGFEKKDGEERALEDGEKGGPSNS